MNTGSITVEDNNPVVLFEQVVGDMVDKCVQSGLLSKQQMVVILEDMIQQVERGTLSTALDSV